MRAPANASLITLAVAALAGCPHPHGDAAARTSPYVDAYPALRWVPAGATYVVTARRVADAVAVARELVLVADLARDVDLTTDENNMRANIGVDLLSTDSLHDAGIDPQGGLAIFSEGLSPTFAIALSDPQRTAGFIEERRTGGVAVEVSREAGVDVYTFAGDRDAHLHWAIVDRWLFVHVEVTAEHEPDLAWYRDLRAAAGSFAAGPDLAAAQTAAAPILAQPPVLGVVRIPDIRARLAKVGAPAACLALVAPVGRVFAAAGIDGKDARGSFTFEVPDPGANDLIVATPAGWTAARGDAPLQVEWSADLVRLASTIDPCVPEIRFDYGTPRLHAVRAFMQQLDLDSLAGRGALWLAPDDDRLVRDVLDEIPGLSLVSHHRKVGAVDVVDVKAPMLPSFSYSLTSTTALAAVGAGTIDAVVGDGRAAKGTSFGHAELHPNALAPEIWDEILHRLVHVDREGARQRTVRRLRHWDLGRVDLDAVPGAIVLTAHGRAHG